MWFPRPDNHLLLSKMERITGRTFIYLKSDDMITIGVYLKWSSVICKSSHFFFEIFKKIIIIAYATIWGKKFILTIIRHCGTSKCWEVRKDKLNTILSFV